jgi:hypothetical protein
VIDGGRSALLPTGRASLSARLRRAWRCHATVDDERAACVLPMAAPAEER